MTNNEHLIQSMHSLHKSGSHGCITDRDRAKMGLALLQDALVLFRAADNKRTVERIRAAISSARGAVRIQEYRETRKSVA
jgi:energy-converting hydrogenase A subunit M